MIIQLLILCGIQVLGQQICQCQEYNTTDCPFPCESGKNTTICQARKVCSKYVNMSDCWFPHCYWNSGQCHQFKSCNQTNVADYQNNKTDVRSQMCQALKCGINKNTSFCKSPISNCSDVKPYCANPDTNSTTKIKKKSLNSSDIPCEEINTCENEIMINKTNILGFDRCLFVDNVCQAYSGCGSFQTQTGCAIDASCEWDNATCVQTKCKDRSKCEAGCQTVGSLCQTLDCNRYQTEENCLKDVSFSCGWNGTHCMNCKATRLPNFFNTSAISLTAIGAIILLGVNV